MEEKNTIEYVLSEKNLTKLRERIKIKLLKHGSKNLLEEIYSYTLAFFWERYTKNWNQNKGCTLNSFFWTVTNYAYSSYFREEYYEYCIRKTRREKLTEFEKLSLKAFNKRISIDTLIKKEARYSEHKEGSLASLVPSNQDMSRILKNSMKYLLKGLSIKQRICMLLYFVECKTMREIGVSIGYSEAYVSLMIADCISSLKARREEIEEVLYVS